MTRIEQLANEIADTIVPIEQTGHGQYVVDGRNPRIRDLLLRFAKEVQRASIEGDW